MESFIKSAQKVTSGYYSTIQRALFTFAKDLFFKNGKRKKSLRIPVQSTDGLRRTIKHRGRGHSIAGSPTNPQRLRLQLEVGENHKFVRHQIPTRKGKSKKKKPHSLAKAVASNRSSERKHVNHYRFI